MDHDCAQRRRQRACTATSLQRGHPQAPRSSVAGPRRTCVSGTRWCSGSRRQWHSACEAGARTPRARTLPAAGAQLPGRLSAHPAIPQVPVLLLLLRSLLSDVTPITAMFRLSTNLTRSQREHFPFFLRQKQLSNTHTHDRGKKNVLPG